MQRDSKGRNKESGCHEAKGPESCSKDWALIHGMHSTRWASREPLRTSISLDCVGTDSSYCWPNVLHTWKQIQVFHILLFFFIWGTKKQIHAKSVENVPAETILASLQTNRLTILLPPTSNNMRRRAILFTAPELNSEYNWRKTQSAWVEVKCSYPNRALCCKTWLFENI